MKSNATNSARQRVYVQRLVFASLFVGVSSVLKLFEFNFSQDLRFNLVEIPWIMSGIVLGPFWGFAVGAVSDIVQYFLRPTGAFNLGFTLSAGLTGLIPGLVFSMSKKQQSKTAFSALTIALFACIYIVAGYAIARAGFVTFADGQILLRGNQISWGFIGGLFAIFVLSSAALVLYYRNYGSPDMLVQPHKVLFSVAAAELISSLMLNSTLLYFMYGAGTAATFPIRVLKVVIAIPVFTTLTVATLNMIAKRKLIKF